jgi:uncharacterized membrane protein
MTQYNFLDQFYYGINTFLPSEFMRIVILIFLTYISYKVTRIADDLRSSRNILTARQQAEVQVAKRVLDEKLAPIAEEVLTENNPLPPTHTPTVSKRRLRSLGNKLK